MTTHNPAQIDLSLVGPNHKLLSTEDLDKPLPEGAEMWCPIDKQWESTLNHIASKTLTYRIPLKLSDRLCSEQQKHWDEKEEQIRVVEAVEKGAEWDVHKVNWAADEWEEPVEALAWYVGSSQWQVRLKPLPPAPRSIPWTLETHPDVASIKKKKTIGVGHYLITGWEDDGVIVNGVKLPYAKLHSDWLQRSGEPCGTRA